ncbi:flagellar basal body P-ring formation chaperone FlgA [Shewanella gelidii]|uniref:Flagella basal body P-ring formation protein FlgA n=1 Tax=Shewanella gelidii TaxID=1642821 RepID=A0A917N7L9_9GAMM|nr:flagellar basal body P-ring formation chaperone FlgA [Shewanella gelidii]MCL1096489.1 flagellar basal body P-ring formation protein FlgA [Shewanella gelidii]GGI67706.1 flagella basal body P-ring formation protein FlgA [Shewanella gelidii]
MKVKLLLFFSILSTLLIGYSPTTTAAPSLSAITSLAKEVVAKKITVPSTAKVEITPQIYDNRLAIPNCQSELKAELASKRKISRNNTVKISCITDELAYPWQIYVSVRVSILYPIVVAKEVLAAGELIEQHQLEKRFIEQSAIRGKQFNEVTQLEGIRVKRRVPKGQPIFENNLCYVCKGDTVSIYARTSNFVIKTRGEALRDGNLGDSIRIRNSRSSKTIDARVTGIGEVEIKM